jgi:hypothetical protein
MLEVEGSDGKDTTSSSTNQKYGSKYITGEIVVTGFTDGIDFSGNTNHTLEVAYKLEGLRNLNCSDNKCFHAELKDQPDYCDGVETGQLENDEPEDTDVSAAEGDGDEGNHIILKILSLLENIDEDGVIEGLRYIDIRKPITHFFDKSVALHRHDGKILACSTFTEVKSEADDAIPSDNTSDGSSMNVALLSAVVLVSSTVALIFSV